MTIHVTVELDKSKVDLYHNDYELFKTHPGFRFLNAGLHAFDNEGNYIDKKIKSFILYRKDLIPFWENLEAIDKIKDTVKWKFEVEYSEIGFFASLFKKKYPKVKRVEFVELDKYKGLIYFTLHLEDK